ncbi:MAG: 30S ribosomal protein S17e [Nanoarchaeota archaeon]
MGKIKSKAIKRATIEFKKRGIEFSKDFERNKKILGSNTMPSKKIRNQLAGYIARVERRRLAPQ